MKVCATVGAVDVIHPSGFCVTDSIVHRPPPMEAGRTETERTRLEFLVWFDGSLTTAAQQFLADNRLIAGGSSASGWLTFIVVAWW